MNESIRIYHGSAQIIEKPQYGYGNKYNDYGMAFYCTESIDLAKEWAVTETMDGYANQYFLNTDGLRVLDLSDNNYNILNWLSILLDNRVFSVSSELASEAKKYLLTEFLPDYKSYDVIKGYRADDSYFSFANAFIQNALPLERLSEVMRLGKLGEQYAIRSSKAFSKLTFVEYHIADKEVYYPIKNTRDFNARSEYQKSYKGITEGTFMMDILRGKWRDDDVRIPRNLY